MLRTMLHVILVLRFGGLSTLRICFRVGDVETDGGKKEEVQRAIVS